MCEVLLNAGLLVEFERCSHLFDQENETADMIESLRMTLADAAFRSDDCTDALGYLNGLFTADAAYKQAQVIPPTTELHFLI